MTDANLLSVAVCERLCDALPRAATFDAAMAHIEAARLALLGPGLLTVNLNATTAADPSDEVQLQRLWSSDTQAYPVAGRKRKTLTPWTRQLLVRAEVFIGEGDAALAEVFDDHALIAALGLRAVVNVPLLEDGRCAATFNVLGTRARWMPQEIALVRLLALLATPWVLRARGGA
ncbi:GAF domain-containing protein [Variovorax boronicumulans]|uniref:GAF domain-containing protein n=1 Tax=Variovorax boronicumulans TaxID=436515 RepID=A0AAW8D217_9BURK|nr:GAF domain-containing protein [Variovorax boronicumulans]MDP9894136.1 GAF domain-containing protein [Variovorax boronicumulans]MDQ0053955.1 GAF domain-containing protein [Variovorax boronicumulans]